MFEYPQGEVLTNVYNMAADHAIHDPAFMLKVAKAGGLKQFVELFVHGEKSIPSQDPKMVEKETRESIEDDSNLVKELKEKLEILELASKMDKGLITSLRAHLRARLTPAEMELVETVDSLSISNLEKEFAAPGTQYNIDEDVVVREGAVRGQDVKIPNNIPGLKVGDDLAEQRAKQNLHVIGFDDNIDKKLEEKIAGCVTKNGPKITSFTKTSAGKLYVLVVCDEYKDGNIVSRSLIQDWAEVNTSK